MTKYGIDNVRGGSFCQINLNDNQIEVLKSMITSTQDKCFNCNKTGHFINDCPNIKKDNNLDNTKPYKLNQPSDKHEKHFFCEYCGKAFETLNGANYHKLKYCKKKDNNQYVKQKKEIKCFKCHENGHYASQCHNNNF